MHLGTIPALVLFLLVSVAGSTASGAPQQVDPASELVRLRASIYVAENNQQPDILLQELRLLRDLQEQYGTVDSALGTSLRVVDLSGMSEDRSAMAQDWHVLARISLRAGDAAGAVAAGKRRLLILKTTQDADLEEQATLDLLDLMLISKRYDEFKHQSEAAKNHYERQKNQAGQARVLFRQGEHLTSKGRSADAISLLHAALRKREMLENAEVARILLALARANAEIKNWSFAQKAFQEAMQLAPNLPDSVPEHYGLLATIHEGLGELGTALHFLKKEASTKDSIDSAISTERTMHMQMLHALQAKEKVMAELQVENLAMADQLRTERIKLRWTLLLCSALSVGLLLLILLRFRQVISLRRTRLKNAVIQGRAQQVEAKGLELERENLHLSQALVQAREHRSDSVQLATTGVDQIHLVDLLISTHLRQAGDASLAQSLSALQGRIKAMNLVHANLRTTDKLGGLRMKAHFTALVNALLSERGSAETLRVSLDLVEDGEDLLEDLLPLSLLVNELLQISMDGAAATGSSTPISITLRRMAHQYELLYTDHAGAINADVLGNGSLSAELVHAWAQVMNGAILLLKSEVTAFQFTFEPSVSSAMRKAS